MNRIPFNDDNSLSGIEGWYSFHNNKLIFYITYTNSFEDALSDIWAVPVYDTLASCYVHAGFRKYAHWMNDFIIRKEIASENVYIIGVSMGGGIAQILGEFDENYSIVSIGGVRSTSKLTNKKSTLCFNRGDLVVNITFWFKKIKNRICLNKKWRPFWKSHTDYDIEGIINDRL